MSTSTNTEVIQQAYEKFGSGDIPGILALCAENIGWELPEIENAPFSGTREGIKAVGEFFAQLAEAEEITRFEPLEFIAQNDKIIVLGELAATVKATGRGYETDWVHVFTVRDGKITNFHEYIDSAAANKAFQKTASA